MRPLLLLLATVVATLALAAPAGAELGRVVTLGDSAATGTGLGSDLPGTPDICNRTDKSYSQLAMDQVAHQEFVNETCDGATTWSLYQGWDNEELSIHIRRQFDALEGDEDVVILHIGNNNSGFGDIAYNCLMHNGPGEWNLNLCTDTYVVEGENTLLAKAAGVATSAPPTEPPSVGMAIDQIHTTSPDATVFLVGYPRITPPDGAGCRSMDGSGATYFNLTPTDGPVFGAWETAMNDVLSDIAADHDAYFVDNNPDTLAHHACQPKPERWSIPFKELDPTAEGEGVPFHTNITGANVVADNLVAAMEGAGLDLDPVDSIGPTVTITAPAFGQNFTDSSATANWTITDTAQDGAATTGVNDSATACSLAGPTPTASMLCPGDTKTFSTLANGNYTLTIDAADHAGNTSSTTRLFSVGVVDNVSPTTVIDTPQEAATVTTSSLAFTWTAADTAQPDVTPAGVNDTATTCSLVGPTPTASAPCPGSGRVFADLANGNYTFTVTSTDNVGNVGVAVSRTVTVAAPPPPQPPPVVQTPPPVVTTILPKLSKVTPSVIRRASRQRSFIGSRKRAGGGSIQLELAEATIVWLRLERKVAGRRSGANCVPVSHSNRRNAPCKLWTGATAQLRVALPQGRTSLHISGNDRGRALKSGQYRVAVGLDPAQSQAVLSTPFRVRL